MGRPTPTATVRGLWDRIEARDWAAVRALLDDELVVEWPVTAERIVGPDRFVRVNAEHPEGWTVTVLAVWGEGERVVSEVQVDHTSVGVFRAVSLWQVRDGLVVAGREHWTSPGSEDPPAWRRGLTEPLVAR